MGIDSSFQSTKVLERRTIAKSFKYAASKEADYQDLMMMVPSLIEAVGDEDLEVKHNALESLTAIVHNHSQAVRSDIAALQNAAIRETPIRAELITEVDLGPFKHKEDRGVPIRKAAFGLLETLIEKIPERLECNDIVTVAIKGLDDLEEACVIQCLLILGRLIAWQPTFVVSSIEHLVEAFEKQAAKNVKILAGNEKAQNIMRAVLRVVEQLHRQGDADQNSKFADFFKVIVMENAPVKDMFDKIAAIASQAVLSEHF